MRTRLTSTAALALLVASGCASCDRLLAPDAQVAKFLQEQDSADPRFAVPGGGEIVLSRAKFDHVLVKPGEGGGLVAVTQVDAEGRYGEARVSYIGLERIPFGVRAGRVVPSGALLPALQEVAALLVARRAAEDARDATALERLVAAGWEDAGLARDAAIAAMKQRLAAGPAKAQPKRWIIRTERERCEVLEETSAGSTRLVLVREAGALRIASGTL